MTSHITLTGSNLGVYRLVKYAKSTDIEFDIDIAGKKRIVEARQVVNQAIESGQVVYGLTTGLGSKVVEKLTLQQQQDFSLQTLRGRAHSLGSPMSYVLVRAAMIARLNTLAIGSSGASVAVGEFITKCLNRHLTPVIGSRGSIGASDLCWGATMGLAFCGEGSIMNGAGEVVPSIDALNNVGIQPLILEPKDGLVLANHSSFSSSLSAFALYDSVRLLDVVQLSAAMTMLAMGANFSPVDKAVVGLNQHPGQQTVAKQLRNLLGIPEITENSQARKIQDPLSIRNVVQVHGAVLDVIRNARETINAELNSCSDNPVVDIENERVLSSGSYYSAHLAIAMASVSLGVEQLAVTQLARMSKLLSNRFSQLPQFLAGEGANANGFAPLMKLAESVLGEVKLLTTPVDHWPSSNADGVEDIQSNAPLAAQSLSKSIKLCMELCAMEVIFAAQALDLAKREHNLPDTMGKLYKQIRNIVPPLINDRPMGAEIEAVAGKLLELELTGSGKLI